MAKKHRRTRPRRSRGMLIRMRDAPSRAPKRKASLGRRIVQWVVGSIAIVAILAGIALLGVRFFFPNLGAEVREATVQIDEIVAAEDAPTGAATPIATIEDAPTWLRVPPDTAEPVEAGSWVRVTYEWIPTTTTVRVRSWSVTDPPPDAAADDAASLPSTPER